MFGQYMMGYYTGGFMWMGIMMLIMAIGLAVALLAIWRVMRANESMARSLEKISQQIDGSPQRLN